VRLETLIRTIVHLDATTEPVTAATIKHCLQINEPKTQSSACGIEVMLLDFEKTPEPSLKRTDEKIICATDLERFWWCTVALMSDKIFQVAHWLHAGQSFSFLNNGPGNFFKMLQPTKNWRVAKLCKRMFSTRRQSFFSRFETTQCAAVQVAFYSPCKKFELSDQFMRNPETGSKKPTNCE